MTLTKNGVCYNLELSPYRVKVNNYVFVFSSQNRLNKFLEKRKENQDIINYSLSKRFKIQVKLSLLCDIVLYQKTETTGFLMLDCDGKQIWQNEIIIEREMINNKK